MSQVFLVLSLFLAGVLRAENPSKPVPVPLTPVPVEASLPGTIRVRFYLPPVRGILTQESPLPTFPPAVWVETAKGPEVLQLRLNTYTKSVDVKAPGNVRLFHLDAEGQQGDVYVETPLPEDTDMAVALLSVTEQDAQGRPSFTVYPLARTRAPAGWHSFANQLEHEVEIRIQNQVHQLVAGQTLSLELDASRQRVFIRENGGKHSRQYTGAVYPHKERGVVHIIRPQPGSARRLHVLSLVGPPTSGETSPEK